MIGSTYGFFAAGEIRTDFSYYIFVRTGQREINDGTDGYASWPLPYCIYHRSQ